MSVAQRIVSLHRGVTFRREDSDPENSLFTDPNKTASPSTNDSSLNLSLNSIRTFRQDTRSTPASPQAQTEKASFWYTRAFGAPDGQKISNGQSGQMESTSVRAELQVIYTYMYICIYIYILCICACVFVRVCLCVFVGIYVCICMSLCMYVCIYIYIYIRTHTHTHAHTQNSETHIHTRKYTHACWCCIHELSSGMAHSGFEV
jgi:hypothetical protein